MKTIHRVLVSQTFEREFEVVAENHQEAHEIVSNLDLKFETSDSDVRRVLRSFNTNESKETLIQQIQNQKDKINDVKSATKQDYEILWHLEDRLKFLIDGK